MAFALSFPCGCHVHKWELNHWNLQHWNTLEIPIAVICAFWWWFMTHVRSALSGCFSQCLGTGNTMLLIELLPSHPISMVGHTAFWGLAESHLIPPPSLYSREGSSHLGSAPPSDMVNSKSVVGFKPGKSGVVLGYNVDWFSHQVIRDFIAQSQIYPGLTGKVSTLTHFPPAPGCKDYYFLDQAVKAFEHCLYPIIMDSVYSPELDASCDEADAIPSSVSSWFLCCFSTISDTSML